MSRPWLNEEDFDVPMFVINQVLNNNLS
jgi:hypothetical protein